MPDRQIKIADLITPGLGVTARPLQGNTQRGSLIEALGLFDEPEFAGFNGIREKFAPIFQGIQSRFDELRNPPKEKPTISNSVRRPLNENGARPGKTAADLTKTTKTEVAENTLGRVLPGV